MTYASSQPGATAGPAYKMFLSQEAGQGNGRQPAYATADHSGAYSTADQSRANSEEAYALFRSIDPKTLGEKSLVDASKV